MNDKTIQIKSSITRIYKYKMPHADGDLRLPLNSNITSCRLQRGEQTLWAEVDPNEKRTVELSIKYVMTGNEVPEGHQHIGIFLLDGDHFIVHVYMRVIE